MAAASEVIRSVTHLVLALGGTNALTSISNRKERDGHPIPDSLRLGFSWSAFSYSGGFHGASRQCTGSAPNPGFPGSRKLSVPGRVHSAPKSCRFPPASAPSGSNPFLTHGTVESPAKLSLRQSSLKLKRVAAPNQPTGSKPNPFAG